MAEVFVLRTVVRCENISTCLRPWCQGTDDRPTSSSRSNADWPSSVRSTPPTRELTLADAAKRTGLTRATVRRSLHTLAALGYVVCADGKWFELTPKVLDLGYAYLSSLQVGDIAQPYMEALSERVRRVGVGGRARRHGDRVRRPRADEADHAASPSASARDCRR